MEYAKIESKYYCDIDLHSRNQYICIIDEKGKKQYHKNSCCKFSGDELVYVYLRV